MSREFKTVEDLKYFLSKVFESEYFLAKANKVVISMTLWGENDAPCDVTCEICNDDNIVLKINNFYEWLDETKEILGEHAVVIDNVEVVAKYSPTDEMSEESKSEEAQSKTYGMMTADEAAEKAWQFWRVLKEPKIENPKKPRGFFEIFNKWGKNK